MSKSKKKAAVAIAKAEPQPKKKRGLKAERVRPVDPAAHAGKTAADAKSKRISALDAAAQVLRKSDQTMRTSEMIAAMAEQSLWSSPNGKTPATTLYAAILREISAKGSDARFRKTEPGKFEHAG